MITPQGTLPGRPDRRVLVTALIAGPLVLPFSLGTYVFSDDHFGRISPGRQISRYGELPFRDFFDPGSLRHGREDFRRIDPLVAGCLNTHYADAGSLTFGDSDGTLYTVLTRRGRAPVGRDPVFSIPCFADRR